MTLEEARQRIPEHRALLDLAVAENPPYPAERFHGRGIVICGGGPKYLPPAWVCIRLLRQQGCTLPIELWHLGEKEMPKRFAELVEPYGVRCVDGLTVGRAAGERRLGGWELKCHALLHSRFAEVLLLDADNVALRDPAFLFQTPEYREHGAIFWPDFGRLDAGREIWGICGIPYRDEPEFESGQIVVDKARCWRALHLSMHLNEHSGFYYRFVHGDKETFHLAWRRLGQDYAMPTRAVGRLRHTMIQHDFAGERLFLHRNMDKWSLTRENARVPGFTHEEDCRGYLRELALHWHRPSAGIGRWHGAGRSEALRAVAEELIATRFVYHRIGHDFRTLGFREDGRVGLGAAVQEAYWDLKESAHGTELILSSAESATCTLRRAWDGSWRGQWLRFEKMPVELTPQPPRLGRAPAREGHTFTFAETMPRLLHQIWLGPRPIGREEKAWADGWRTKHPGWHYQLWTDEEVARLDFTHRALYDRTENYAMKADILRYELLHRYGGVYADLDFECLRPLGALLQQVDSTAFAGYEWPTVTYRWSLCNALLGALPGAPFLTHVLAQLAENVRLHTADAAWHGEETIPRATGPAFLTRCAGECGEITLFPQPVLYPHPAEVGSAYARHHFKGSWRAKKTVHRENPMTRLPSHA